MNRRVLFSAAAAAMMLFSLPALADPAVAPAGVTFTGLNGSWIDGTNLLETYDAASDAYCVTDLNGNVLTDSIYRYISYRNGYLLTESNTEDLHRQGLIALDGTPLIDNVYGDIKLYGGHWAAAIILVPGDAAGYDYENWGADTEDDKYFLIDHADFYYLSGNTASLAGTLPRENFGDCYASGNCLLVEDRTDGNVRVYDSGWNVLQEGLSSVYADPDVPTGTYRAFTSDEYKTGIMDAQGNVVVDAAYTAISDISHGYASVYNDGSYGLIDLTGRMIIPTEMNFVFSNYYSPTMDTPDDTTDPYPAGGYVAVNKEEKLAYFDLDGNLTAEPVFSVDAADIYGASAIVTDQDGSQQLFAADGTVTDIDAAHSDLYPLGFCNGYLYTFRSQDYTVGLMDWHGNELLPAEFSSIYASGDGQYLLVKIDYDNTELYKVTYDQQVPSDTEGLISEGGGEPVQGSSTPETQPETGINVTDETDTIVVTDGLITPEEGSYIPEDDSIIPGDDGTVVSEDGTVVPEDDGTVISEDDGFDASLAAISTLLSNASALAGQDFLANEAAIRSLLDSAYSLAEGSSTQAAQLISAAGSLLGTGSDNSTAFNTLISNALAVL